MCSVVLADMHIAGLRIIRLRQGRQGRQAHRGCPIICELCQQVTTAVSSVVHRPPGLEPESQDFVTEIKLRTVDRYWFLRIPFAFHALCYVLTKRDPRNTAMFTGLDGERMQVQMVVGQEGKMDFRWWSRHGVDYTYLRVAVSEASMATSDWNRPAARSILTTTALLS